LAFANRDDPVFCANYNSTFLSFRQPQIRIAFLCIISKKLVRFISIYFYFLSIKIGVLKKTSLQ